MKNIKVIPGQPIELESPFIEDVTRYLMIRGTLVNEQLFIHNLPVRGSTDDDPVSNETLEHPDTVTITVAVDRKNLHMFGELLKAIHTSLELRNNPITSSISN